MLSAVAGLTPAAVCCACSQVVLEVLDNNVKRGCAVYETGQPASWRCSRPC